MFAQLTTDIAAMIYEPWTHTYLLPPQALDHTQHQSRFGAALESQMLQQPLQHQAGHTVLQHNFTFLILKVYLFHPLDQFITLHRLHVCVAKI